MTEGCGLVATDDFIHNILTADSPDGVDVKENSITQGRFQELLVRNFVSSNPKLKFCPYPGCTNTVSCPAAAGKSALTTMVPIVSCGAKGIIGSPTSSKPANKQLPSPGNPAAKLKLASSSSGVSSLQDKEHVFCFGCPIETDHRPVICAVAKMWLQKCEDDSETANWIKSNTKECSQCQSTIEKNGGCKWVNSLYFVRIA